MFWFFKKNKYKNDGVFINNGNGTVTVAYSKYDFLKKGDVISFGVLCETLVHYKMALITNEYMEG